MSLTSSSDRLTFLSYVTFNHHFPIHDHSWRQHQWKQTETMVALASLALQIVKKLFQKGNLENKCVILILSGADFHAQRFFTLQAGCFHTLRPHNCVQAPNKSDFYLIGPF